MKDVVEYFSKKGIVFKELKKIDNSLLKTRKKINIYKSTDINKNYHSIFFIEQKSRYLVKNIEDLVLLSHRLEELEQHNFRYKHFIIKGAICSKATSHLKELGWKIHNDFM